MALWQFDIFFVPHGQLVPAPGEDGYVLPPFHGDCVESAQSWLGARFGAPWTMMDDWLVFGEENGNRVDLLRNDDGSATLSARLDARIGAAEFRLALCELADVLGCHFFSAEQGCVLEPQAVALSTALLQSRAAAYARNPMDVLCGQ